MHNLYILGRIYPYLALSVSLICGQFAIFYRRRDRKAQFAWGGLAAFLAISSLLWVVFRGDLHADQWVQTLFSSD